MKQGDLLSPLFFLIFINDLHERVKASGRVEVLLGGVECDSLGYADDLVLVAESVYDLQTLTLYPPKPYMVLPWRFNARTTSMGTTTQQGLSSEEIREAVLGVISAAEGKDTEKGKDKGGGCLSSPPEREEIDRGALDECHPGLIEGECLAFLG
uniref:Reverse transcriptase domain-containing protein n=1 Tax=Chromera velia CCMP2878 TaxID=1169474 RepID=A0A0G4I7V3_9ALVE|eukprot:Cvel_1958.t1-p1 / transcript=Cvel_1958.t1 / gene=Cvel_1958 / organism=Chromera_velia_CCMP2878 / gene_product=hypothetical protein / transcript_product=hypothetical protein / location=Cvel_scaffold74:50511-62662(-) / protein_length=153 / sequence_SO=supercontig / SO=protein_coding / is_pseudo=false